MQFAEHRFWGREAFSPKGGKCQCPGRTFPRTEKHFSENKKRLDTEVISAKLKKLELNSTNLKLKSKKTHSDCAKKPDPSVCYGLTVKNKTIRDLLDSGSSGDLLFMKKGSNKCISIAKQVVPQSWGTSNGTFVTDKVGDIDIEISFMK
jgi:hypothetical protein